MNFTQLRCFIKAIDNSSFTIAAEQLNFSQSAVSKNIKDLENEMGVILINRAHHRISLTNAGRYFYRVARNVLNDIDYTVAYLQSQKDQVGTVLRLGFCNTPLDQKILPIFLSELKKINSSLDVQLVFALNNSISELLNHHIDICTVGRDSVDSLADINFETLIPGKFFIACPHNSTLGKRDLITLNDLRNQNLLFIDPHGSLGYQTRFQSSLITKLGIEHVKFVQDFFSMEIHVKAGLGLGILPNFIADVQTIGINYVPLDYEEIPPYGIAYIGKLGAGIDINQIVQTFKKAIKQVFLASQRKY